MLDFHILGTRGTTAVCSPEYLKYGGSTTSFRVKTDEGFIIIDAGTGVSRVAKEIGELSSPLPITMIFTHFHLDHLSGLPSFNPLYNKDAKISIMADPRRNDNWRESLTTLIGKPYWPIGIGEADATMEMKNIPVADESFSLYGIDIKWCNVPHPQQCLAFRLSDETKSIVVATDVEFDIDRVSHGFIEFCEGADHLIFDAQYTPEEYKHHIGWGHSTWEVAAYIANKAHVGQLLLTHHAPERTDDEIDKIIEDARRLFKNTDAAVEGMRL
jgi:ribonuclease BN (tRNA processing enzyme)